jgi:hypothetical protein
VSDSQKYHTRSLYGAVPEGTSWTRVRSRRRISPEAGRALEVLGHAIEYLADEYLADESMCPLSGRPVPYRDGRIEAIDLLAAMSRWIYCACPEVPRLRDRILELLFSVFSFRKIDRTLPPGTAKRDVGKLNHERKQSAMSKHRPFAP